MLPSLAEVEGLRADLLRDFMALTLHPPSLAVTVRICELGIAERLVAEGGLCHDQLAQPRTSPLASVAQAEREGEELAEVSLEMALELGAGLGLLSRRGDRYHATELSRTFLCRGSSLRLLGHVDHYAGYLPSAGSILPALHATRRSRRTMWTTGGSRDDHTRYFAARQAYNEARRGYFWDSSYLLMRAHLRRDLSIHRRACDVGAGPAGFAALLAKHRPGLEVHAVEANLADEGYRRRTEHALRAEGVEVTLWPTNALLDPLPPALDLVTFNRLLSGVPRDGVDAWLDRARTALVPGGALAAVDYVMTGDPEHDRFVAAVVTQWMGKDHHLLTRSPPTDPHDDKHQWGWTRPWHAHELCEALRRAGLRDVGFVAADPPLTLIFGTRA